MAEKMMLQIRKRSTRQFIEIFREEEHKETLVSTCSYLEKLDRQVYYRALKSRAHKQSIAPNVIALVPQYTVMLKLGTRKLYPDSEQLSAIHVGRDKAFGILKLIECS
jgi:hypothetical protein